ISSAGRAPAAYPKVGLAQRRSASSASPTEPTPACRSVSPGMKAREYRRKVGGRKAAVRPRRDPRPRSDAESRYAERRNPTARPVMEWRRPFTRRNGKRTTFAEDDTAARSASRHRLRPPPRYPASKPRAWQTLSKLNGHSVAGAANHSSASANKRCPRRVEEVTY